MGLGFGTFRIVMGNSGNLLVWKGDATFFSESLQLVLGLSLSNSPRLLLSFSRKESLAYFLFVFFK
jgi:hypothetical protein